MPKRKDKDTTQLLVARVLYRSDKWDPERDTSQPFEWNDLRASYMQKSSRFIRMLDKDGLQVSVRPEPAEADAGWSG